MLRCYILICSAVALRIISGAAGLIGVRSPEEAYVVAVCVVGWSHSRPTKSSSDCRPRRPYR